MTDQADFCKNAEEVQEEKQDHKNKHRRYLVEQAASCSLSCHIQDRHAARGTHAGRQ